VVAVQNFIPWSTRGDSEGASSRFHTIKPTTRMQKSAIIIFFICIEYHNLILYKCTKYIDIAK
jgi:hypothetical protein